jgi:hypothetical protein
MPIDQNRFLFELQTGKKMIADVTVVNEAGEF